MRRTLVAALWLAAASLAACERSGAGSEPVASVKVVAPDSVRMGGTLQLSATVLAAGGRELTGRAVEWASDNPDVVRVDERGMAQAVTLGTATVTARAGGQVGTLALRVLPPAARAVHFTFAPSTLKAGFQAQLAAVPVDEVAKPIPGYTVAWSSSDSAVARVSATGLLTALRSGRVTLSAAAGGAVGRAVLDVTPNLHVWPDTSRFAPGMSRDLAARKDSTDGSALPLAGAAWSTSDPAVVRVDAAGRITAVGDGSATITARVGTDSATSQVYVASYPAPLRFASVAPGRDHVCALTDAGQAYCWGNRVLGTDQPTDRCETVSGIGSKQGVTRERFRCSASPVPVAGSLRFTSLSSVDDLTCGIRDNGSVYCWSGPSAPQVVPTSSPLEFRAVEAGCGIATSGTTYCWGRGEYGVLGNGNRGAVDQPTAAPVTGGQTFAQLTAGAGHRCGLTTAGAAFCWGRNVYGELGIGPDVESCGGLACSSVPRPVAGNIVFQSLEAGGSLTCGLDTAGRAYCWGMGFNGQLGTGGSTTSAVPVAVSGGLTFTQLSVGNYRACALTADGSTYCWGLDVTYPSGPTAGSTLVPTRAAPDFALRSVRLGGYVDCGFAQDGVLYCWGYNQVGETGSGSFVPGNSRPVRVAGQS